MSRPTYAEGETPEKMMNNKSERVARNHAYPLRDMPSYASLPLKLRRELYNKYRTADSRFESPSPSDARCVAWIYNHIASVWTGEKRCPKKGEWFLSGSTIEAYCASNDMTMVYHIAKLVRIEKMTTIAIHSIEND